MARARMLEISNIRPGPVLCVNEGDTGRKASLSSILGSGTFHQRGHGRISLPPDPYGQNGEVIGRDGYPLERLVGRDMVYENFLVNIGSGQTWDVLFEWYDAEGYDPITNPVNVTFPSLNNVTIGIVLQRQPLFGLPADHATRYHHAQPVR